MGDLIVRCPNCQSEEVYMCKSANRWFLFPLVPWLIICLRCHECLRKFCRIRLFARSWKRR